MIGLFAFFYGCLHFMTWFGWTSSSTCTRSCKDFVKRRFITAGFSAFVLMIPLAMTSTTGWIRRLGGKRWQRLHRLIYVTGVGGGGALLLAGEVRYPPAAVVRFPGGAAAGLSCGCLAGVRW